MISNNSDTNCNGKSKSSNQTSNNNSNKNNKSDDFDKLIDLLNQINGEFDNIESFIEADDVKCERFKTYLKRLYDYIKIQDDNDYISTNINTKATNSISSMSSALPELIIDKKLVDLEQIYQQLQLYNQNSDLTSSASINSLTKFFSKCLVQLDSLSFNIDFKNSKKKSNIDAKHSGSSLSNEDSVDAEADEENDEDDGEYDEDELDEDEDDDKDSIDELIKYSKEKSKSIKDKNNNNASNFGIPDGSDSEISDFEVEGEVNGEEEDDEEDGENGENDDEENEFADLERQFKDGENEDEIDSDEVDEDLTDLYQDLGDEKEVLGIGKPTKAFEEVDFDREDFGLVDDEDDREETTKSKKKDKKTKDLFDVKNEDSDDDGTKGKSSFELREERLKEKIQEIHDSMIKNTQDKPWQLKGEISSKARPQDSLLEEYLEFDHTTRQAPVMSAATTEQIEKMIKQRIKDKAFDDVERKVKPVDMQYEYKKQVVLDHEKSKLGLGDIYEQEYLKQQQKESGEAADDKPKEEASNPKHEEIRKLMQTLFIKLDALSNFHYTPKAPVPELKVVSNMPTIAMEEVAPVNVADTNILAPEEIKAKINALPKGKSEETKSDKNKNLRIKKLISRKKKDEREKRLQMAQALDPNNATVNKEIAMNKLKKQAKNLSKNIKILKQDKNNKSDKAYKSSSAFFKQLQENNQISKKVTKKKLSEDAVANSTKSSKKLKL